MPNQDPESVWSDYFERKKSQRLSEAASLWALMEKDGVTEDTVLAVDFVHFSSQKEGAESLANQLKENYSVEVVPGREQDYWYVNGTTRPYGISLTKEQHMGWVEFMSDVARSYACVFSTWSVEVPSLKKKFSSENIDSVS